MYCKWKYIFIYVVLKVITLRGQRVYKYALLDPVHRAELSQYGTSPEHCACVPSTCIHYVIWLFIFSSIDILETKNTLFTIKQIFLTGLVTMLPQTIAFRC